LKLPPLTRTFKEISTAAQKKSINVVGDWLPLFSTLLTCDVFEKQLTGLNLIADVVSDNQNKEIAVEWYQTNGIEPIVCLELRPEFKTAFEKIYPFFGSTGLFTEAHLMILWENQ
jgi:hypothetical protein